MAGSQLEPSFDSRDGKFTPPAWKVRPGSMDSTSVDNNFYDPRLVGLSSSIRGPMAIAGRYRRRRAILDLSSSVRRPADSFANDRVVSPGEKRPARRDGRCSRVAPRLGIDR